MTVWDLPLCLYMSFLCVLVAFIVLCPHTPQLDMCKICVEDTERMVNVLKAELSGKNKGDERWSDVFDTLLVIQSYRGKHNLELKTTVESRLHEYPDILAELLQECEHTWY